MILKYQQPALVNHRDTIYVFVTLILEILHSQSNTKTSLKMRITWVRLGIQCPPLVLNLSLHLCKKFHAIRPLEIMKGSVWKWTGFCTVLCGFGTVWSGIQAVAGIYIFWSASSAQGREYFWIVGLNPWTSWAVIVGKQSIRGSWFNS